MSRGLNKVMIIGHLGRDPELRHTAAGKAVTNFSVGVTRSWHDGAGERQEQTEWFNVVAWSGLAEVCDQHLRQGDRVYVEGRLQSREWEDGQGGTHKTMELVAREMIMLGDGRAPATEG